CLNPEKDFYPNGESSYLSSTNIDIEALENVSTVAVENTLKLSIPKVKTLDNLWAGEVEKLDAESLINVGKGQIEQTENGQIIIDIFGGWFDAKKLKEGNLPALKKVYECFNVPNMTSLYSPEFEFIGRNFNGQMLEELDANKLRYIGKHGNFPLLKRLQTRNLKMVEGNLNTPCITEESDISSLKQVGMIFIVGGISHIKLPKEPIKIGGLGTVNAYREIESEEKTSGLCSLDDRDQKKNELIQQMKTHFDFKSPICVDSHDSSNNSEFDLRSIELDRRNAYFFVEGVRTSEFKIKHGKDTTGIAQEIRNSNVYFSDEALAPTSLHSLHILTVTKDGDIATGNIEQTYSDLSKKPLFSIQQHHKAIQSKNAASNLSNIEEMHTLTPEKPKALNLAKISQFLTH
ncbi:hypothetical protein HON22_05880, partial [Candidatus Peregrinibacteria bacterium]|nr:hypothetical protein [Candidatus Peregrinibacteria bacterium]